MITLRPHHILCIQSYMGKGYDSNFIKNMDSIVDKLRKNPSIEVKIVFGEDDICACCPNKLDKNLCVSNTKVKLIDNKVIEYLSMEEEVYRYDYLIRKLKIHMNQRIMNDICGSCEWYKDGTCKEQLYKKIQGESKEY